MDCVFVVNFCNVNEDGDERYTLAEELYLTLKYPLQMYGRAPGYGLDSVRIHKGFSWNGSNVVRDRIRTLRASCVHDFLVKEMVNDRSRTWSNWKNAAKEYRDIAKEDGFSSRLATIRYLGILAGFVGKGK